MQFNKKNQSCTLKSKRQCSREGIREYLAIMISVMHIARVLGHFGRGHLGRGHYGLSVFWVGDITVAVILVVVIWVGVILSVDLKDII